MGRDTDSAIKKHHHHHFDQKAFEPKLEDEKIDDLRSITSSSRLSTSSSLFTSASSAAGASYRPSDDVSSYIGSAATSPTLSTTSSRRPLNKTPSKSKILLVHPSIATPSYAKKLDGIHFVTVLYNPKSGNKRGEKVMQQAVLKFQEQGLAVTTIQLQYLFFMKN